MERMDLGQVRERVKAEDILKRWEIHHGEPIPAAKVEELIAQNETEIVKGVTWNFYREIKQSFLNRAQSIRSKNYILKRQEVGPDTVAVDLIFFLKTFASTPDERRAQIKEYKLVFTYKADKDQVEQNWEYVSPEFIGLKFIEVDQEASYENVSLFLEQALRPPEEFVEANNQIDRIWNKHSFPLEDANKLKAAIKEFGNHEFKKRNGFHMIGSCLSVPYNFEDFVKRKYSIKLKHCELTGARKRREAYSNEEKAELESERSGSEVHEASVYHDQIVMDWTSRQFGKNRPIPEIIDLNERPDIQDRIEITDF